jgi:sugar phosphate isomerase/epimerase
MKIICSLSGITDFNWPVQGISDVKSSGFEQVFLDLKHIYKYDIKESQKDFSNICRTVISKCKEANINIEAIRTPYIESNSKEDSYDFHLSIAKETIRLCNEAECKYVIISPIVTLGPSLNQWEVNRQYYSELVKLARENNVTILLENQYRNYNGHYIRGICSDEKQAIEWIDSLNEIAGEERFGICMNTGTFNLCGQNMQEYAVTLGKRVKAVILRDSYGNNDVSMLPFTAVSVRQSNTDWLNLIRGLREIGFDGSLIFDVEDTAVAFSPLLRPQLLALTKSVAEYFSWQINIENQLKKYKNIVLFGAGNMCRNYMKCYGEKYPPMFTCDNNSKLWGTNFCGLEVKSPEALKDIPSDCGIFICNIYYREIEKQLRDMGIKNNIEFFNDEYLPSYRLEKLERM